MSVAQAARRLVERRPSHRVISVYLDLDPERFATAPARASQIHSLIDAAGRQVESDDSLDHEDLTALREDLQRLRSYLLSREPPFKGARALAVFSATRDDLFEAVQLTRPVQERVMIEHSAYVEPLVDAAADRRWCAALVNRREGRVFAGTAESATEQQELDDDVHGQHEQGGWSQSRYERSYEKEVDDHLRRVANVLDRRWRRDGFDRLALGGPPEIVPRLEALLTDELRSRLAPARLEVDLSSATEEQVREALFTLAQADDVQLEREALDRLAAGIGSGGRAVGGPQQTAQALNERRVQTLLLAPSFDHEAYQCPTCALLALEANGDCPVDGSPLRVRPLREGAVQAALIQDAGVLVVHHHPDLGPFEGIAALLRF